MHPLRGRKQSSEHIAKRVVALKGRPRAYNAGTPRNTPEVLWSKVDIRGPDECWPWKGFTNEQGYGRTWFGDKGYYAHRVIYNLAHPGEIELSAPKDHSLSGFMMHSCDNPPCCNPAHLKPATRKENMADSSQKGRRPDFRGTLGPRAKLTEDDVIQIRNAVKIGTTRKALELLFEVSRATIDGVLSGRHYRDI